MKKAPFLGSGVAIVTPMNQDGPVNYEMLGRLTDFQIENGTDAVAACGTTGESATLSHEEHYGVLEYSIEKVNHRVPVIASTGGNDVAYAIELTVEAKRYGANAQLNVAPYYNKTSQAGLVQHLTHIADATDLPIILYNVPSRTGCSIQLATYLGLSKHPNIVATKEANGDISAIAQAAALCGDNLYTYSGNDNQTLPILSSGGKGIISVIANIYPALMRNICQNFFDDDIAKSRALSLEYLDLMNAMFIDVNPIPVKGAVNLIGYESGKCRLSLVAMNDANREKMVSVVKKRGLI